MTTKTDQKAFEDLPCPEGYASISYSEWGRALDLFGAYGAMIGPKYDPGNAGSWLGEYHLHYKAERWIELAADKHGLDPLTIRTAGRVYRDIVAAALKRLGRRPDTPEAMNELLFPCRGLWDIVNVGEEDQLALARAYETLVRLKVKLAAFAADCLATATVGSSAQDGPPPEIIAAAVAERDFEVTRKRLRLAMKIGKLTDCRQPGHARNDLLLFDRREVMTMFPRRG